MQFNLLDWRGQIRRRKTRQYFALLLVLGACVGVIQAWIFETHQHRLADTHQEVQDLKARVDAQGDELDGLERDVANAEARGPGLADDIEALVAIGSLTKSQQPTWHAIVAARPAWVWLDRVVHHLTEPAQQGRALSTSVRVEGRGLTSAEVLDYQARLAERLPGRRIELLDQQQNAQGLSDFVVGIGP